MRWCRTGREDGVRRFHLARVAPSSRLVPGADRLERMEEIAELDRRGEQPGSGPRAR